MTCERWQQGISARADGEDPGMEPRLLDAHVATCAECRRFASFVEANLGRARVAAAPVVPDLSGRITKLNALADRAAAWSLVRILLAVVAIQVIAFAIPPLVFGGEADTGVHSARHLGAFSVAYGVGLLVVVARPARARTLLPVAAVLAGALGITAVIDMAGGRVPLANETSHLPELLSVLLVWMLAAPSARRRGQHAAQPAAPRLRAVGDDQTGASTRRSG